MNRRLIHGFGTLPCKSPEIMNPPEFYSEAVDLWSVGVVLLMLDCEAFLQNSQMLTLLPSAKWLKELFEKINIPSVRSSEAQLL
jgi:serine/threonine protein kinase